jgi:hypothetical protein
MCYSRKYPSMHHCENCEEPKGMTGGSKKGGGEMSQRHGGKRVEKRQRSFHLAFLWGKPAAIS